MCRVNVSRISPNEVSSLDVPPRDSPRPSPTPPPQLYIQIQEESLGREDEDDEGEQTASSVPCIEIQAVSVRRSSEPLPCSLPEPQADPPRERLTYLTVASEHRFKT